MMYLLLAGVPNPHNVNDNTSGVCGVLALMESFAAEKPEEIAFVLFDNEEKGLLGASGLAKAHKQVAKKTLVLNMDCIGVGEAMLMLVPRRRGKAAVFRSSLATWRSAISPPTRSTSSSAWVSVPAARKSM